MKELEQSRKASLVDEELCMRRAVGMAAWKSSSLPVLDDRSTIDGSEVAVGTTKGEPSVDLVGSEKLNPPIC